MPQAYERIPNSLLSAIGNLSVESRRHLLERVPAEKANLYTRDLVAVLVGDEEELLAAVFARAELRHYQDTALRGRPTASWLKRAAMALDHGWTAEQVVAACTSGLVGWTGPEAEYWGAWVEDFRKLGRSGGRHRKQLSEAGVRRYISTGSSRILFRFSKAKVLLARYPAEDQWKYPTM